MILAEYYLRVFSDNDHQGNDVRVAVLSQPPLLSQWQNLADRSRNLDSQGNPQTICFIVSSTSLNEQKTKSPLECRWYQGGREVQLCGSGILAAAYALEKHLNIGLPHVLKHHHRTIPIERYDEYEGEEHYSFALPRFQLNEETVPAMASQWFQHHPVQCMSCGDERGYWIVEFSTPITELIPDLKAICATTQRAIIATSALAPEGYDYSLRYFAPQYGIDEDVATGSANAVLASYWYQQRKPQTTSHSLPTTFRALQHQGTNSNSGGSITLRLNESQVWVAGRVTELM